MKNKIAIASAFLAAASFSTAEIVVNDFLSFEGFVDSSYSHTDTEVEGDSESDNSFGVDQVEISWLFNFDAVTAQIDLEYEDGSTELGGGSDGDTEVEQAFVNYALGNGDVITAGRYASMLGFEAYEPTGLYQYSTAYDVVGTDLTFGSQYNQGVKFTRTSDTTFFGISVQDEAFGDNGDGDSDPDRLGGAGDSSYAVEVAGSMDLGNGLTVFVGAVFEDADLGDNQLINAYVTYETGAWLFAAEINVAEYSDYLGFNEDLDLTSGLLMANYAYSDVASVTARLSAIELEIADTKLDITKYTLAHNYALSDNLLLVTEINYVDGDIDDFDVDGDATTVAVELLFSF